MQTALLDLFIVALIVYGIAFYVLDLPYWLRLAAGIVLIAALIAFPVVSFVRSRRD